MNKLIQLLLLAGTLILVNACEDKMLNTKDHESGVHIELAGLADLAGTGFYEGWLIWKNSSVDTTTQYKSIGILTPDALGVIDTSIEVEPGYLQGMQVFVISVEPDTAQSPKPGSSVILSGKNRSYSGNLYDLIPGLRNNFWIEQNQVQGKYMLATPTDAAALNPLNGLWFVQKDEANELIAGLTLPVIPANWKYEAFIVQNGDTLSLGKFNDPALADLSNLYGGSEPGYKFPGEDFLNAAPVGWTFPLNLQGAEVFITLTPPHPLASRNPYLYKLMEAVIPAAADTGQVYEMSLPPEDQVSGILELEIEIYK